MKSTKMHSYYSKDKRKYSELSYEGKYLLDPKYMTKRDLRHYYRYYNMTRNRSQLKKIIIIIFCICFFSYIFIDYNLKTKIIQLRDRFDFIARVDVNYYNNTTPAYFVDTPGCRMPYFATTDENILQFMSRPLKFECKKALIRTNDSAIHLTMNEKEMQVHYNISSSLAMVHCFYREIKRDDDYRNVFTDKVVFKLDVNRGVAVPPGIEFIYIECMDRINHKTFYKDVHFFVVNKLNTTHQFTTNSIARPPPNHATQEKTLSSKSKHKKQWSHLNLMKTKSTKLPEEPVERVSVMMLGIDSVSHLNFLRQMQRTAAFIHQNLTHVEFWGYNKVGDNSYPNLVPVLTGLDETELNISCLDPVKHTMFDKCHFIWKKYKEAGYQTVFAEDVANLGLFNTFSPGFKNQPTDYYFRTAMVAMERYIAYMKDGNVYKCMGGRRTADILMEYIRKLIPYLSTQNFFSFFWTITLTHDDFNYPVLLDKQLLQIFELFNESGIFNKTVIFFMSDHGMRWGSFRQTYQGMVEERQPLFTVLYPRWFRQKYPAAINNMELNARRLTTHFDLHATLLDLLDLRNLNEDQLTFRSENIAEADTLPRSISLFLPVPVTRTCENAGLTAHWCTCHRHEEMPTNDLRVQRAARYLIKLINDRLKAHPQCRVLYLNSILKAIIAAPHQKLIKDVNTDYSIDIMVRVQAKPGLGLFESTVRMSLYTIGLTGGISRINLYGSQSYCTEKKDLKIFCYCHR